MTENEADLLLNQEILRELKAVSEKSFQSRFQHDDLRKKRKGNHSSNGGEGQSFLESTPENSALNQYWYSKTTIEILCEVIIEKIQNDRAKVAFLSTPSLYFALPLEFRANCFIFDIDKTLSYDPNYIYFDFNRPEDVPSNLIGCFDMVVIDPPFIGADVWEQYAVTVYHLMREKNPRGSGLILATTIAENDELMLRLFQAKAAIFKPSIPNLVYQYRTYCNFSSKVLSSINTELP